MRKDIYQNCTPEPNSGCWLWTGSVDKDGYGWARKAGKVSRAHRVSWETANGCDANGQVLHRCDTPSCINPDHLRLGTIQENMRDRDIKGRVARGETSGQSKLTENQVREIRALHKEGASMVFLGIKFNIDAGVISRVVARKSWAHIP